MKSRIFLAFLAFTGILTTSCSNDDDPEEVNEEEIITTMTIVLRPTGGGTDIKLQSRDLDGDGPNPPVIIVSEELTANTTYNGTIQLLNETVDPAENITDEVEEEAEEHQFFFSIGSSLSATPAYSNFDANNNPLGTEFVLESGDASTGSFGVTLRHDLKKPNDGTLADAGGETDIAQTFPLVILP